MQKENQNTSVILPHSDASQVPASVLFSQQQDALSQIPIETVETVPVVKVAKESTAGRRWFKRSLWILILFFIMGVVGLLLASTSTDGPVVIRATDRFDPVEISLSDLPLSEPIFGTQSVTVNGTLQAGNGFIIAPSLQPSNSQPGQLYYDQTSNILAYFNGSEYIPVSGSTETIILGGGLTSVGGQLTNTGVLSIQGQTGNVDLTAGNGMTIVGTTIANSGVVRVVSSSPTITVATDPDGTVTLTGNGSGTVMSPGGTIGSIPLFTGDQTIDDSIISQIGLTVTIAGDLSVVTGGLSLSNALTVSNGGTGITSLALNGVLVGQGTAAITAVSSAGPGLCLVSTAGAPTFAACPGGGGGVSSLNGLTGALSVANASGAGSSITIDNASTSAKGIAQFNVSNFSAGSGIINTIQDINSGATPTFAGVNTNNIIPSATLTVGATGQQLTLQGNASTQLTATGGGFTTALGFAGVPSGNVTYNLDRAAAPGTYVLCSSVGNCAGQGGSVGGTGTLNQLAKFTATGSTIGDSTLTDTGTVVTTSADLVVQGGDVTVGVPGSQTGSVRLAHNGSANLGIIVQGALTDNRTYTLPDANGTFCLSTGNCSGAGTPNTLQAAYDAGNIISTTDGRDIDVVLADSVTTDANFDIVVADGSSGFVSVSRADGSGTADPAQLILVDNLDLTRAVAAGIKIQAAAGGITTGLDVSDNEIDTGVSLGANDLVGTTGNLDFTNFDVTGSNGNVTAAGNMNLSGGGQYQISGVQISSANLSNDANLAKLNASQTFTGNSNAFQNVSNSVNAFNVQNAAGSRILTIDTQNGETELGVGGILDGRLIFNSMGSANAITLVPTVLTDNRTITLPDSSGIVCLDSGNCAGAGATLQTAYNFSLGGTIPKIKVTSGLGGVDIQDADTTIGANLFNVRASDGAGLGSVMFGVASTGQVTLQNATNSTTALRLLTQGGTSVLTGDTTNGRVILGQGGTLAGSLLFHNASNSNVGTLQTAALGQNTTYTLPDPLISTAIICLNIGNCSGAGSTNNLQNAYNAGNTIDATDGRNIAFNLTEQTTDPNFLIDLQCDTACGANGRFAVQDDGTDVFSISPSGGLATFATDADFILNGAENIAVTSAPSGTTSLNVLDVQVTNGTTSGTQNGVHIQNADDTGVTEALLVLNNADPDNALTTALKITDTGATAGTTTAIDASDASILTAINIGANTFLGTTANFDFTNFDVTGSNGNVTTAGDLALNGGDLTSSGALNITPGGALVVGSVSQTTTLQGSVTTITSSAGNDIVLNSGDTIELQDATNVTGALSTTGIFTVGALGATDTASFICRNSSNQLAACSGSGAGAAFVQGGNSFGATAVLGTNDANALELETGGITRLTVGASGGVTLAANNSLSLASGTGTFGQIYTGTTIDAHSITANSLTTGSALKVTSSNNSGVNTAWSANQLNVTNAQATNAVSNGSIIGFDVQFTQNTTVAGNNETAANFAVKQNDSSSTDNTVASIINVANNDTATGNQVTVTDGIKITGTNITNGINLSGTFGSNLITSSNFNVTQAGAITGVGVNAGTGLIQGAGGLTASGAAINLNVNSNFATNINTGTSNGTITLGGSSAPLVIDSTAFDVTSGGAVSGVTTLATSGIITQGALGTADTATYLCRNASNQIATCSGTAAGTAFIQGGNSFGATAVLGTNDANGLNLEVNNVAVATFATNGAALFKNQADSTTAFRVQNAANLDFIAVNTSASAITIGNGTGATSVSVQCGTGTCGVGNNATDHSTSIGSATGTSITSIRGGTGGVSITSGGLVALGVSDITGTLLVLDTKTNSGDPLIGANGGMYYNANLGKFRCYQNNVWVDCIGATAAEFLRAENRTNQTTNVSLNDHVKYADVQGSSGSSITLDTTSGYSAGVGTASVGRFTLKGGKTYKLRATIPNTQFTSNAAYLSYAWYDATNSVILGGGGCVLPETYVGSNDACAPYAEAVFSPAADTLVEVRFTDITNFFGIGNSNANRQWYPSAYIELVSDSTSIAQFQGATAGTAGQSGFVPAPAAGQQGAVLLGNGTWSTGVSFISGAATFQNVTNSTTAFRILTDTGSSSLPLFTVDTSGSRVNIGNVVTDTTAVRLVLDSASGSDPTGVNGAMYYNTTTQKFRCFENSEWRSCVSGFTASGISNAMGAGTTTSATYVDLPATSSVTITKQNTSTKLLVHFSGSLFTDVAGTEVRIGIRAGGVDYDCTHFYFNVTGAHFPVACSVVIPGGITAGSQTIQARWRRAASTGILTVNTADWITLTVQEVY